MNNIFLNLVCDNKKKGKKMLAILIDPDKKIDILQKTIDSGIKNEVDFFFVGGSLITHDLLDKTLNYIKENCEIPVILFPGNEMQLNNKADGILLLSLISGRNADFLIGKHVISAPYLKNSGLEVLPTGYMLIDSGVPTSVSYMSNTTPIPANKPDIAYATALAGEYLGMKLIYMDGGSGALHIISEQMIKAVSNTISIPLVVGGGIKNITHAMQCYNAGADIIVIGNGAQGNNLLIEELCKLKRTL